jgi:hypothetical protein
MDKVRWPPLPAPYYTTAQVKRIRRDAVRWALEQVDEIIAARVDKYETDMEGADHDDFIMAQWAAGAMRHLQVLLLRRFRLRGDSNG